MDEKLHCRFVMALTEYDKKQSKKRGYNIYALAQYFERLKEVEADIANGTAVPDAVHAGFFEPLNSMLVKEYAKEVVLAVHS